MRLTKKVLQPLIALFLVMVLSVSCDWLFGSGKSGKSGKSNEMTFIGTIGEKEDGGVGQYTQTPCYIHWEKGKQPIIEPIEGITLGYGDHPTRSGQAGNHMLISSGKESVRREYHKDGWTGGPVPYLIDLKTREWIYMPHIKGSKENGFLSMSSFFVAPNGKEVYYTYVRYVYDDYAADDGLIVYNMNSGETGKVELQGLLDVVGFIPTYTDGYGMKRSHGWSLAINCITPDSQTLIGTIRYNLAYGGFGGRQGGATKIFRYDIPTGKFDEIVGDSEGTPSFITILNDNETLYFCNYGYGFSHHFKYNLKTRKVTRLPSDFGSLSGLSMNNHIRLDNQGLLQAGGTNNNFYHKEVNGKLEVIKFKNLPYEHQNSLQFNKSRTKVYALKTGRDKNYYVELKSLDAEAPVDTLFALPPNVGNLMQIW